jgi:tetratricopeptide (TPR) repeat protein
VNANGRSVYDEQDLLPAFWLPTRVADVDTGSMNGAPLDSRSAEASGSEMQRTHYAILVVVCALIIGVYGWSARSGVVELWGGRAANSYYNLLVQGFFDGQLNLKRDVPPGFARLADPYDPAANRNYLKADGYPLLDLSYYQGKLYLYFGVTPVLLLFWPYTALTDDYLLHKDAVVIFCAVGFLASVGLLYALWRRYFATVNFGAVIAGTIALGLVPFTPAILPQSDVYEVAISCGYALAMLALAAIWRALHNPLRRSWWLAAASLAYGLAVGARPSLLFGAVILLVPVMQIWRERRQMGMALLAASGPIVLVGVGLMFYNYQRFGNPREFGLSYMLLEPRADAQQYFSLRYFWFNFRIFFWAPAHWTSCFPFVHHIAVAALPKGYIQVANPYGLLSNIPVVWLALAAPLVWRDRSAEMRANLRRFSAAVALLFGACALTLCCFCGACIRYELDFAPALVLLAVMGILGLERALAGQPIWRWMVRWGWGLALAFSVAFNLLASVERQAEAHSHWGRILMSRGQMVEAIVQFRTALKLHPDSAIDYNELGGALFKTGQLEEAKVQLNRALEIKPDFVAARSNLGNLLFQLGRWMEATQEMRIVLELEPDRAVAHNNLGFMLFQHGCWAGAIEHFQKACERQPDEVDFLNNLAWLLATCPEASLRNGDKAIERAQQAKQLTGGKDPNIFRTLAAAFAEARRYSDAVATAQRALELAVAQNNTSLAGALQEELKLYQANQPFHLPDQVSEPAN